MHGSVGRLDDVAAQRYNHYATVVLIGGEIAIILWDFPRYKDQRIKANNPAIVVKGKSNKVCLLFIYSLTCFGNLSVTMLEHQLIIFDLTRTCRVTIIFRPKSVIEIERAWNLKTVSIRVFVGALRVS